VHGYSHAKYLRNPTGSTPLDQQGKLYQQVCVLFAGLCAKLPTRMQASPVMPVSRVKNTRWDLELNSQNCRFHWRHT
jgi:hypothetical protein